MLKEFQLKHNNLHLITDNIRKIQTKREKTNSKSKQKNISIQVYKNNTENSFNYINNVLPTNWDKALNNLKEKVIQEQTKVATRKASQMCLENIVPYIPQIIGGSADLAASNLTFVGDMKTITSNGDRLNIRKNMMFAFLRIMKVM